MSVCMGECLVQGDDDYPEVGVGCPNPTPCTLQKCANVRKQAPAMARAVAASSPARVMCTNGLIVAGFIVSTVTE